MVSIVGSYIVYKHTCPNGKGYIGITSQDVKERWKNGKGYIGALFYKAIQKYGWENIKHEVLFEGLTKEQAEEKEIELIALYKSNQREYGYNVANGGGTNSGFHISEETKKILSEKSKANNARYWLGKTHSAETRQLISEQRKGKPHSEETKKKISTSLKGIQRTETTRQLMSEARRGKKLSAEHKEKLSKAHKGKKASEETRRKMSLAHQKPRNVNEVG